MMNTISTDNTHLVDVIFIVSTMGVPPVIIQILVGFSLFSTIQLLGYPRDYGNPPCFVALGIHGVCPLVRSH